MVIVVFAAALAAETAAAVERDGGIIALAHLKRQKRKAAALGKTDEHIEKLPRDPAAAAVGTDGHFGDAAFVHNGEQPRVADDTAVFRVQRD